MAYAEARYQLNDDENLYVKVSVTDKAYPDLLSDICGRARQLLAGALTDAVALTRVDTDTAPTVGDPSTDAAAGTDPTGD